MARSAHPPLAVLIAPESADEASAAPTFEQVYDAWFEPVHRWVRALGGPSADLDDLTQEVFIVVQRKLGRFDGKNLAGWLYTIARNIVSDHRRRWWWRSVISRQQPAELDTLPDGHESAERALERGEAEARFYRLVGRMNRRWRDSFVLFEVLGYSGEEIASLQATPHATVRTHLHRARREFLGLLEREERM